MEHRRLGARSLAVILVLCWFVCAVEGNYTLAIWVQGYQNPSHQALELQTFRHGCCERDTTLPCDPCDNAFKFCVREGTTGMVLGGCDIAELQTARVAEDDDDLMFSLGDDIGGVTNPLMVTGDVWPGMIEILFTVYDLDGTVNIDHSSDVVDNLLISPDISAVADDSFSDTMSYSGNFSHVQLAFRLTCGPAHYGADCSVYCEEVNDTTGHFTCDPATGDRLCLEGYSDPLTNCTECSQTAVGCSVLGGYCTEPGQCLCREGFSGENCSEVEQPCLLEPCLNGSVCMNSTEDPRNYTCQCLAGFKGLHCNEMDPCTPNPCQNDGMCTDTAESSRSYTCVCASGFKGQDCGETKTDACTPNPCVNGTCLEMGEEFVCECESGYTGMKCEEEVADAGGSDDGGGGGVNLLVIVVAAIGGVLVLLISAVFIAICVLLCRGRKMKTIEGEEQPNPYEAPSHFLSKWGGGGGHASNGLAERKFDNPLYQEGSLSPVSPPLPPRPEHPYATLEDVHPVALIPTSEGSLNDLPLALVPMEGSLDEKPPQSENTGNSYVDPQSGNAPYDHVDPQPTVGSLDSRQGKAPENPYLEPANPMNSSTVVYAHIQ